MYTHVEKPKENTSDECFAMADNRTETVAQRKQQELVNTTPQVKQTAKLRTMAANNSEQQRHSIQKKENNTGLPDNLKSGIENLSGYSMDDVKVHYNSDKPAQLQAHAYAQGADIHLAYGQEKHLPHEAWHVVQQKQGRVKPTIQMKNMLNINDDEKLEKEADEIGVRIREVSQFQNPNKIRHTRANINVTAVAQRVVNYSGYDRDRSDAVIASIRNFEKKEAISSDYVLTKLQILNGMVKMDERSQFFGEFDLNNYQQVGLLYYQIKRQGKGFESDEEEITLVEQDKPFKKKQEQEANTFGAAKQSSLNINGFSKLALLGMGSSIGYYITSLGKSYDHKHTIVIGKENPWKSRRGIVPFVNHPMGMIEPWGKEAPESQFATRKEEFSSHEPEDVFASRTEFAQKTKEAIVSPAATVIDGSVKKVSKAIDLDDPTLRKLLLTPTSTFNYKKLWDALEWRLQRNNFTLFDYIIETDRGFYAAKKVVMGTGGGPHRLPNHAKVKNVEDERIGSNERAKKRTIRNQVMDMDAFLRLSSDEVAGKNVVVQGTNAAIDAADRAIADGGTLVAWLGSKPPFLYKTLLKNAPSPQVEEKRVAAKRDSEKILIQNDGTLKISFTIRDGESTTVNSPVTADYFVYGIGQDIDAEDAESDTSGPAAILSKEAFEALRKNEAVIKGDSAGAFDSTYGLGLRIGNEESGLSVIGASAWRLSRGKTRGILDEIAKVVPSNVVSSEQLGAIKSSTGAMNSYMPEYIGKGFNWLTADPNMIVAYLIIQHPNTPQKVADGFIKSVRQLRRLYPNGIPESVKKRFLTGKIKGEMATQMALETANFLRRNTALREEEMVKTLKSTLLFLVPDQAQDVTNIENTYNRYSVLEAMLNIWLDPILPNESIAKKKSL